MPVGITVDATQFCLAGKDYTIILTFANGASFPIITGDSISYKISKDVEEIFVIGQADAAGIQTKGRKVDGTLVMQAGEINTYLTAGGYSDATRIENATISIVGVKTENPLPYGRVLNKVTIMEESFDLKAADSNSKITMPFKALIVGI